MMSLCVTAEAQQALEGREKGSVIKMLSIVRVIELQGWGGGDCDGDGDELW